MVKRFKVKVDKKSWKAHKKVPFMPDNLVQRTASIRYLLKKGFEPIVYERELT